MKIYFTEPESTENFLCIGLHGVASKMVKFMHRIRKTLDKLVVRFSFIILIRQSELVFHAGYFIRQLKKPDVCLKCILQGSFFKISIK